MAVYERGYRTYHGGFEGPPGGWVIFVEAYRHAWRSKGFRLIGFLFIIWFVIWGGVLYQTLGVAESFRPMGDANEMVRSRTQALDPENQLQATLGIFYGGVSFLSALLVILVGAGLVSDDLRTRALPLYLVRPISASDYVVGKALVLPTLLLWVCLLPGLLYYLLVGMWRPPGETTAFLRENLDIVHLVFQQYLIAAASYTGLMLFLSSRTSRRGSVMGLAAAIVFLGTMLAMVSRHLATEVAAVFRYLGIPWSFESGFAIAATEATVRDKRRLARIHEVLPDPDIALWIALGLLLLGLWSVWRRARTVEVTA